MSRSVGDPITVKIGENVIGGIIKSKNAIYRGEDRHSTALDRMVARFNGDIIGTRYMVQCGCCGAIYKVEHYGEFVEPEENPDAARG